MPSEHPLLAFFDSKMTKQILWFSGMLSIILIMGLSWYGLQYRPIEHFDAPKFLALREEIKQNPTNENLIAAFRIEDLNRRMGYFESRRRLEVGGLLLFASLSIFVLALRRFAVLREGLPQPLEIALPEKAGQKNRHSALATLLLPLPIAFVVLVSFVLYARNVSSQVGEDSAGGIDAAVAEAISENERWNQFRGNNGLGIAPDMEIPIAWNAETEENIAWKVPLPLKGNSSPIIWGKHVFLTGADVDRRKIFCFDLGDGTLLWETAIQTPVVVDEEMKKTEKMGDTGFGSPTSVTDGRQVVAFFGTNEIAAVDFSGKQVWSKWLGKPNSFYGVATSLCLYDEKVLLQLDQGTEEEPESALYAFNPADGRILWKTDREVGASWSSPIAANTGDRDEILTAANPWVISYNPANGSEWWRAKVLEGDVAPLPAYGDGMVFTAVEYSELAAVETGGSGDVTETNVRWTYDEELPDIPSPVTDGRHLLLPTSYGYMLLFDAKTGENLWTEELDGEFWSSPIIIGDKVYLTDIEGKTFIFRFGPEFEMLGEGEIGEKVVSSPAFVESRIVIRGEENLCCIGSKEWPADTKNDL